MLKKAYQLNHGDQVIVPNYGMQKNKVIFNVTGATLRGNEMKVYVKSDSGITDMLTYVTDEEVEVYE